MATELSFENQVEARLNITLGTEMTDTDIGGWMNDGYRVIIKTLKQQGAINELRYFMKESASVTVLTGVISNTFDNTVFTKSSHKLLDGDTVDLSGFTEATELNGMKGLVVQNKTTHTFELAGISSDPAETTGGTVEKTNSGSFISNDINMSVADSFDGDLFMILRRHNTKSRDYDCREISLSQEGEAGDVYSSIYATKQHPVYMFVTKETFRVLPAPTSTDYVKLFYIPMPPAAIDSNSVPGDADWSFMPDAYSTALMYYVCSTASSSMVSKYLIELKALSWSSPSGPTALSLPSTIYNDFDLPTAPVYIANVSAPDFTRMNTFLDDDDAEMSTVSANKLQMEIQKYATDVTESAQKFAAEAKEYDTIVAQRSKTSDGTVAAEIQNIQNKVQDYVGRVQKYAQDIQETVAETTYELQEANVLLQKWQELQIIYDRSFKEYMMNKLPQPQPKAEQKGDQNAR